MDEITILQAEVLRDPRQPAAARDPAPPRRRAAARSVAWPTSSALSQPNVSQHLAVLRAAGLVEAERDGREVRYRLADPDVMVACGIMRGVLERRLRRLADLSSAPSEVTGPSTTTRPALPTAA